MQKCSVKEQNTEVSWRGRGCWLEDRRNKKSKETILASTGTAGYKWSLQRWFVLSKRCKQKLNR
jgi:hypothetical protein